MSLVNSWMLQLVAVNLFYLSTAKWCHVDCFQVPVQYFYHMLSRLGSPMLDSVREVKHSRQPIFTRKTKRFSYKIFDEESFRLLLNEQDALQFRPVALFRNHEEVADISEMDAEEALALAKQRARNRTAAKPTSRSVIEIGIGEGWCTREVEPICWPGLYSFSQYGKLTVRFFVRKTSMWEVKLVKKELKLTFDYSYSNNRELSWTVNSSWYTNFHRIYDFVWLANSWMKAVLFDCRLRFTREQ